MPLSTFRDRFFTNWQLKTNSYWALLKSLGLAMLLYTLARLVFYLFNYPFFAHVPVGRFFTIAAGGLRFDLAAVLYSNALFILLFILPLKARFAAWYQRALQWLFISVNALALAVNIADSVYYPFTLRRTTLSVVSQFKNEQNLLLLFGRFMIDYWYAFIVWALLVWLLIGLYKKIKYDGPQTKPAWLFYGLSVAAMPLVVYLFIGGARGGFLHSTRPITLSNAAAYTKDPKEINLVLNTPFALMRTAKANVIKRANYFSNEETTAIYTPVHVPADTLPMNYHNVVIIILESFSKEFVGRYNYWLDNGNYTGYTPFLDSLIGVSRGYEFSLANGRKSIDAMPSVICSIPSIEVPYVLSHFSGNRINSLASLLKEKGYRTAFFHGAPNGSMGFDAFARLSGFDEYYGKDEYNNNTDYDGIWGIWDEPFLQYVASTVSTFKEPFFTTFFSVSSHHPYKLPAGYQNNYRKGPEPIYETIQYTDDALRKFFKTAATKPWFANTLFVITADHASAVIGHREYNSLWGYFSIPVFFFKPGAGWGSFEPTLVQQIDIMPTVLGYLHYDKPYVAFGRNAFEKKDRPFAFNYLDQRYQAFQGDYLLQFDGTAPVALYNFKSDKLLQTNLLTDLPDTVQVMERRLKAFIQQYNNRMVADSLTVQF
ncbi:MAG: sulfatase-like hydrolase/transferase [Cytophagales bacterium]|nr:sulfatase-like hydrolase/transferase [Cytophagales bacterium]